MDCNNQGAYRELLSQYAEEQLRYQNPKTGDTVLHIACEKRDSEMVRLFCKKGSLVNIQNVSFTFDSVFLLLTLFQIQLDIIFGKLSTLRSKNAVFTQYIRKIKDIVLARMLF